MQESHECLSCVLFLLSHKKTLRRIQRIVSAGEFFYKYIFRQADILKSPPAAYCFSQLKQGTYLIRLIFSISQNHCIRFPYSGISLCTFLYFLKYTGICFYSAFINSRMISRMISSSSGESILLKWLPVAAV